MRTPEQMAADEQAALREVARIAGLLRAHGSYVFPNDDSGRQLLIGTGRSTAYAFVVDHDDADELGDALDQLEQSTNPDWP